MSFLITIILGILTFNLSAETDRRIIELTGKIAEKYNIKMVLTIKNQNVLGYYFYESVKIKILLDGKIDGTKIILNESPDYEPDFKVGFIGELKDNMIIGNWIDNNKKKSLSFKSNIVSDKILKISESINQIEGFYLNIYNSDKYLSSLYLNYITDNVFCFLISNGTESGCTGYIKKLIELDNLSSGTYSGELCEELKISFIADTLVVKEKKCEWHGMRCPFDGKYLKKEKGSP